MISSVRLHAALGTSIGTLQKWIEHGTVTPAVRGVKGGRCARPHLFTTGQAVAILLAYPRVQAGEWTLAQMAQMVRALASTSPADLARAAERGDDLQVTLASTDGQRVRIKAFVPAEELRVALESAQAAGQPVAC